jgi:signal transduction histidine kinase
MDVSMPELDGFELAEIIRQHPRYQKTAIIFVSAVQTSDLDRLKGYDSGAVDYVSVPVIPQLLRAKVRVFADLYRKTREAERLNRELEDRVAERTQELERAVQTQMELADRLREADRRKDEFLALLAHELRNPLAPIVNAVGVMRLAKDLSPELAWCRDVIDRQARQLTRLVDDLLDVSRITRGKIRLRSERVDLARVIEGAVETSRPGIDARKHELVVTLPQRPIELDGDSARLTQVVANLLNNAVKFQDEGGRIELKVDRDGDFALIAIRDHGYGITAEALKRVFELFTPGRPRERPHAGRARHRAVARAQPGRTARRLRQRAQRGPGAGEHVHRAPAVPRSRRRRTASGRPCPTRRPEPPELVLVVDDNVDAADSLAVLLRMRGHEVRVAHDGPPRSALAEELPPPSCSWTSACRAWTDTRSAAGCAPPPGRQARIIAMTGYGQERIASARASAGFDAHAVKPVEFAELAKLLIRA